MLALPANGLPLGTHSKSPCTDVRCTSIDLVCRRGRGRVCCGIAEVRLLKSSRLDMAFGRIVSAKAVRVAHLCCIYDKMWTDFCASYVGPSLRPNLSHVFGRRAHYQAACHEGLISMDEGFNVPKAEAHDYVCSQNLNCEPHQGP